MTAGIFLDVPPVSGTVGVFAAVALFFVLVAVAFVVFRLLKRTVSILLRLLIVGVIVAVALFGSIAVLYLGGGSTPHPRPTPVRPR